MAIVYISHQMGAGGPEIGMALAQRLGYRYVNQELLLDAARRYGLAEDRLSHLDESKPTLFERFDTETRHHITVLQTTCLEFAEDDNCVLMRGGGQWLLRGVPHVLRVRIIAPFEHRVKQWIKRTAEMTGETPNQRAAAELVRRDGLASAGRARDAPGDAALPDHRRGPRRRRDAGGDRGPRARGRGRALGARRARGQDAAGRDSTHPAVRGLKRGGGGRGRAA